MLGAFPLAIDSWLLKKIRGASGSLAHSLRLGATRASGSATGRYPCCGMRPPVAAVALLIPMATIDTSDQGTNASAVARYTSRSKRLQSVHSTFAPVSRATGTHAHSTILAASLRASQRVVHKLGCFCLHVRSLEKAVVRP